MNIFIDESGSFVSPAQPDSWSVVAAYALPETARRGLEQAISDLKFSPGHIGKREVKLHEIKEPQYLGFLEKLIKLNGCLFGIATDAGLNTPESVHQHQILQAKKISAPAHRMRHESGRQSVLQLAAQVENLSPQLYVQLFCQIELMYEVISRAVTYYAQRTPGTLSAFRWRIDRKDITKTAYEDAFEKLSPALLQTISFSKPLKMVKGFDYRKMKRFEYASGEMPAYLKVEYGIEHEGDGAVNIGKLIREDLKFMDSRESVGLQAVDLIASGIRRCLRGGFQDNNRAATLLGNLMVQAAHNDVPLRLLSFGAEVTASTKVTIAANLMRTNAKKMIL